MSYGKVHTEFWTDDKVMSLSCEAKLLALYLLSGPHRNAIGCMRMPHGYIQGDLGWEEGKVKSTLAELCEVDFITRDDSSGWTLINNLLKYDPIKGDKAAIGAARVSMSVPKGSPVYAELYKRLQPVLELELKAHTSVAGYPMEAPSKGDTKPHASPNPSLTYPEPSPADAVDYSAEFDVWYVIYPLHKSRGQALKAYRAARKKTDAETLIRAAERYRDDPARKPEFTKHPASWLNGECWADESKPPDKPPDKIDPVRALRDNVECWRKYHKPLASYDIKEAVKAGLMTEDEARAA